jgi:hypothetical protein
VTVGDEAARAAGANARQPATAVITASFFIASSQWKRFHPSDTRRRPIVAVSGDQWSSTTNTSRKSISAGWAIGE